MIGGETAAFFSSSALIVLFALLGAVLLQVQCKQSKRSRTRLPQKGRPAAALPSARSLKTAAADAKKTAEPEDRKPYARRPQSQKQVVASHKELSLDRTAFSSTSDKSKKESSSSAFQSKEITEKTAQEVEEEEATDLRTPSWMASAPMPVFQNNIPVTPGPPAPRKKGALKKM